MTPTTTEDRAKALAVWMHEAFNEFVRAESYSETKAAIGPFWTLSAWTQRGYVAVARLLLDTGLDRACQPRPDWREAHREALRRWHEVTRRVEAGEAAS